jgi:hypothetical protein
VEDIGEYLQNQVLLFIPVMYDSKNVPPHILPQGTCWKMHSTKIRK